MADHDITALVLRETRAEWTRLEERKGRFEMTGQQSVDLALPEGTEDWSEPEALAVLKAALAISPQDRLCLSVSTDQVLLRVVDFPTVDTEELQGMAELQVDKVAPFPTDQMYMSIEVLAQTEDTTRMLIAAVPHSRADRLGAQLHGVGLHPVHVDVDVLGWWRLIKDGNFLRETGVEMLMIADGPSIEFVYLQEGVPLMFRALDSDLNPYQAGDANELVDELDFTLTTLEGQWGRLATGPIQIWHRGEFPQPLQDALEAKSFMVERHTLDELPPLSEGIGRRAGGGETTLNLAPDAWRLQRQAKALQKIGIKVAAVILSVWAVAIAAILLVAGNQRSALTKTQDNFDRLREEVETVRALEGQVKALQAYGNRQDSALECLREVSELLPPGVDLTSFSYRKLGELSLRGEAQNSDPIYTFFARMEQSQLFVEVRPEGVTSQIRNNQPRSLFRITGVLPGGEKVEEGGS